jgi:tRNA dimethylallyltransferase
VTQTVLVLAGATASGKTELALELAQRFDGEIVGADSRQIYRDMTIGTAAPSDAARALVPHHMVAFLDPRERYSAARYANDATGVIRDILARGKRAIVAGGTGFYIRALTGAVELAPQYDESIRERLAEEARVHPPEFLHAWLALRDPRRAAALEPGDTYRVLRALEVALAPHEARARSGALGTLTTAGIPFVKLFLDVPLDELDARIERRTTSMIRDGLIEEAERIGGDAVAASAVGYPQALAFTRGWSTADELHASLARATRRYARRQRAWFRREPAIQWATRAEAVGIAESELSRS